MPFEPVVVVPMTVEPSRSVTATPDSGVPLTVTVPVTVPVSGSGVVQAKFAVAVPPADTVTFCDVWAHSAPEGSSISTVLAPVDAFENV